MPGRQHSKVSIELPVTSRHRRDITERLLKVTLRLKKKINKTFFFQVEICPMDYKLNVMTALARILFM